MKIMQVLLSPRIGGAEALAESLDGEFASKGTEAVTVYLERGFGNTGRLRRLARLRAAVRRERPDVVIAHSLIPALYARLVVRGHVPLIYVLHSAGDDYSGRIIRVVERSLARWTSAIVAVGTRQAEVFLGHFPALRARTRVIPNGIRPDISVRRRQRIATVGALARVVPFKRPDVWLAAARRVIERRPGLRFVWYGPDADGGQPTGLDEPGITFAGPTTQVPEVLDMFDVFFHSSDREAAGGIVLLEAAASGLPIVCSDSAAEGAPTGMSLTTFRAGDPADAAQALISVIDNASAELTRAAQCASAVAKTYGAAECGNRYLDLCFEVTGRTAPRPPIN